MTPLALRVEPAPARSERRFGGAPLAVKLAIAFLGLVAFVLIVNGAVDTYLTYNQAKSAALEVESEKARGAAERVGAFLAGIQTQLGWTAGVEWGYASLEQQRYDFVRLLRQAPAITALAYIDGHGKEQIAISRLEPDSIASAKDFSADPRFVRAVADKIWFGPVEFRRGSEPYMTIALAHVGKTPGVTVADVNLKLVWDVVSAIHIGAKGFAYVVDDHGRLIAHPDLSLVLRDSDFSALPQVAEAMRGRGGGAAAAARSLDGGAVLTAFAIEPKTHWVVFVEQPLSEALAAAYATLARAAGLLGLGLLLSAVSGVALARRMAAPIRQLQAGAEKLGAGDLAQRLDIRTGDEIEALAGGFNRMAEQLQESYENLEAKVEERTKDLNEALQQQTATADVLKAISGAMFDPQTVLDTLINSATALSGSTHGMIWRFENGAMHSRAFARGEGRAAFVEYMRAHPQAPGRGSTVARVALTGEVQNIADVREDSDYSLDLRRTVATRATIGVPMKRGDALIGAIVMSKAEAGLYSEPVVELTKTFADQAVIAIENARLFEEVQARTRDLEESLARQTATADVLKIISRSIADAAPVFETILESCQRLFDPYGAAIYLVDGDVAKGVARRGFEGQGHWGVDTTPLAGSSTGQAIAERRAVQFPDLAEKPDMPEEFKAIFRETGGMTVLYAPMLSGERGVGSLIVSRRPKKPFSDSEIDFVQTFADQAVIAIENARLFAEVQARTRDLEESLAQQTATADVLKVISRSMFDLQGVFEILLKSAIRLVGVRHGMLFLRRDDGFKLQASDDLDSQPAFAESMKARRITAGRRTAVERVILTREVQNIADLRADPEFDPALKNSTVNRALLAAPMKRGDDLIGVIVLARPEPGVYSQRQIELVETFADQAVIAIENARLFDEVQARTQDLTEALQMQTATSDVLKVISRSAFDLDAVFTTLLTSAIHLSEAHGGAICLREGEAYNYRSVEGTDVAPQFQQFLKDRPASAGRGSIAGRAILSGKVEQIYDVLADPDYQVPVNAIGNPSRAMIGVPMLREDRVEGVLVLIRAQPGYFSERQIGLIQTFADQAVIAIENVRLFDEVQAKTRDLQESLAQQTATADVLKVISRSAFDLDAIFQTLVTTAVDLCRASSGTLCVRDGDLFRYRGMAGPEATPELQRFLEAHPLGAPTRQTAAGRAILSRQTEQIEDVTLEDDYAVPMAAHGSPARSLLGVPLMGKAEVMGAIVVARAEPGAFPTRHVEILRTFADQAVIAIENSRLFEEVRARTRELEESLAQQTATANVLKVISRSAFDLQSVSNTLLASAAHLCQADRGAIYLRDGDLYRCHATFNHSPEAVAFFKANPRRLDDKSIVPRVVQSGGTLIIEDVLADPTFSFPGFKKVSPSRALLGVPLLRQDRVEGVFSLARDEPSKFSQRQIELVQTFADQALIAVENTRLFDEVQARTRELETSLSDLRKAQDRLVQSEKLASLGQLTAGIAHEIKNPLNFVNNFASLSRELLEELREALGRLPEDVKADADDLMGMIDSNLEKVASHGKRADSIVKNMLLHSREGSGERTRVNVNAMVEEALNLGYHGARAEKPGFNVTIEKALDSDAGEADLYLQEVTRVLLNLVSNGLYATAKRKEKEGPDYQPTLTASTQSRGQSVEIRIRDNGTGIPEEVRAKMFNPFFTTKPAGEGTGLGLSLSHDIVVKQHGGTLDVETAPGAFTEFVITLPREGPKT